MDGSQCFIIPTWRRVKDDGLCLSLPGKFMTKRTPLSTRPISAAVGSLCQAARAMMSATIASNLINGCRSFIASRQFSARIARILTGGCRTKLHSTSSLPSRLQLGICCDTFVTICSRPPSCTSLAVPVGHKLCLDKTKSASLR